ncbi:hypothetical protein VL15_28930 [Burkholderia cepacia]|uniref:Uncharacterized protein n=1 Tax=Burkholderia cepacia TaxID=292 RepID=A0A0J5WGW6_BURCE|nr:hypothetical protein VL15_28930 [Burkholderia cepacia]
MFMLKLISPFLLCPTSMVRHNCIQPRNVNRFCRGESELMDGSTQSIFALMAICRYQQQRTY